MGAEELEQLYEALIQHAPCASARSLALATGFTVSAVEDGLRLLVKAGLAKNSAACVEEIQFSAIKE